MKPDDQYGLLIEPVNRYGTEYIEVRVCRRDDEHEHPLGCPADGDHSYGYGCPKHLVGLVVDGLGMRGFISDVGEPAFIAYDVEFSDIHAISERKLKMMAKAIRRVNALVEKEEAREPGDKFMALAKALKLSFAVERIKRNGNGDWRFMPVSEGRNRYRALIEEAVAAAVERKAA